MDLEPVDDDLRAQETASRPLIAMTIDKHSKVKEVLHIEKHGAVCDIYSNPGSPNEKGAG
jgi:hypothetical protein